MAHCHRHRNGLLRPGIPVVDMHVRAADRGLGDLDEHIVGADFRLVDVPHPDAGLRLRLDQRLHRTSSSSRPTRMKAASAVSICVPERPADIWVRMRASPLGTTGNENPTTYTPSASMRSAKRAARAASPIITGMIGCSPGSSLNPAALMPA